MITGNELVKWTAVGTIEVVDFGVTIKGGSDEDLSDVFDK